MSLDLDVTLVAEENSVTLKLTKKNSEGQYVTASLLKRNEYANAFLERSINPNLTFDEKYKTDLLWQQIKEEIEKRLKVNNETNASLASNYFNQLNILDRLYFYWYTQQKELGGESSISHQEPPRAVTPVDPKKAESAPAIPERKPVVTELSEADRKTVEAIKDKIKRIKDVEFVSFSKNINDLRIIADTLATKNSIDNYVKTIQEQSKITNIGLEVEKIKTKITQDLAGIKGTLEAIKPNQSSILSEIQDLESQIKIKYGNYETYKSTCESDLNRLTELDENAGLITQLSGFVTELKTYDEQVNELSREASSSSWIGPRRPLEMLSDLAQRILAKAKDTKQKMDLITNKFLNQAEVSKIKDQYEQFFKGILDKVIEITTQKNTQEVSPKITECETLLTQLETKKTSINSIHSKIASNTLTQADIDSAAVIFSESTSIKDAVKNILGFIQPRYDFLIPPSKIKVESVVTRLDSLYTEINQKNSEIDSKKQRTPQETEQLSKKNEIQAVLSTQQYKDLQAIKDESDTIILSIEDGLSVEEGPRFSSFTAETPPKVINLKETLENQLNAIVIGEDQYLQSEVTSAKQKINSLDADIAANILRIKGLLTDDNTKIFSKVGIITQTLSRLEEIKTSLESILSLAKSLTPPSVSDEQIDDARSKVGTSFVLRRRIEDYLSELRGFLNLPQEVKDKVLEFASINNSLGEKIDSLLDEIKTIKGQTPAESQEAQILKSIAAIYQSDDYKNLQLSNEELKKLIKKATDRTDDNSKQADKAKAENYLDLSSLYKTRIKAVVDAISNPTNSSEVNLQKQTVEYKISVLHKENNSLVTQIYEIFSNPPKIQEQTKKYKKEERDEKSSKDISSSSTIEQLVLSKLNATGRDYTISDAKLLVSTIESLYAETFDSSEYKFIPIDYLYALIDQESDFNPYITSNGMTNQSRSVYKNGKFGVGASGFTQILLNTHSDLAISVTAGSPEKFNFYSTGVNNSNIPLAAKYYIAIMFKIFKNIVNKVQGMYNSQKITDVISASKLCLRFYHSDYSNYLIKYLPKKFSYKDYSTAVVAHKSDIANDIPQVTLSQVKENQAYVNAVFSHISGYKNALKTNKYASTKLHAGMHEEESGEVKHDRVAAKVVEKPAAQKAKAATPKALEEKMPPLAEASIEVSTKRDRRVVPSSSASEGFSQIQLLTYQPVTNKFVTTSGKDANSSDFSPQLVSYVKTDSTKLRTLQDLALDVDAEITGQDKSPITVHEASQLRLASDSNINLGNIDLIKSARELYGKKLATNVHTVSLARLDKVSLDRVLLYPNKIDKPALRFNRANSKNYASGRILPIRGIVLHSTDGPPGSAENAFDSPRYECSSHYIITRNGSIVQMVNDADTAYHAGESQYTIHGVSLHATRNGFSSVNSSTIGIEIENWASGSQTSTYLDVQYASLINLVAWLCLKYDINFDFIVTHAQVAPTRKGDPSGNFDYHRLFEGVAKTAYSRMKDPIDFASYNFHKMYKLYVKGE